MRKALIGLILAATAITPIAAEARGGRGDRGVRNQNEGGRGTRAESPRVRSESPPPQQQTQQQPQSQPAPQQQPPVVRNNDGGGNRGGNRGGDRGDRGGNNNQPSSYPEGWRGDPNDPRLQHYRNLERRNQERYDNRARRGDRDDDGRRGDRNWRRGDNDDRNWRRGDRDGRRNWNRDWRRDRRYDWSNWRLRNRHIFRTGRYHSPYRDWRYRRFSIGIFLQPLFFNQNYWIGDPWQYRLPPAPPGTQWVRYYNDVLLVDVDTGEVIDVIYDFFW